MLSYTMPSFLFATGFMQWWGLSAQETLLLVGVILMLVDFFVQSDALTHVAYVLFACLIASFVPLHILFKILIGFGAWVGLIYLHYAVWRDFVTHFANRIVAPTKYQTGPRGLIGKLGHIKIIDTKAMVSVEGDLWSYEAHKALPAGTPVRIVGERGGSLHVEALEEDL